MAVRRPRLGADIRTCEAKMMSLKRQGFQAAVKLAALTKKASLSWPCHAALQLMRHCQHLVPHEQVVLKPDAADVMAIESTHCACRQHRRGPHVSYCSRQVDRSMAESDSSIFWELAMPKTLTSMSNSSLSSCSAHTTLLRADLTLPVACAPRLHTGRCAAQQSSQTCTHDATLVLHAACACCRHGWRRCRCARSALSRLHNGSEERGITTTS